MPHLSVLDLFCGCGGASLGLRDANFDILGGVDIDSVACDVYFENLGFDAIRADLAKTEGKEILDRLGIRRGGVDILVGCPPCQAFSSLRRTTASSPKDIEKDQRNDLIGAFLKRVGEIEPHVVIFENVPGVAKTHEGKFLADYLKKMKKLGYESVYALVNAADYGVPQRRNRLIALSLETRDDGLKFPSPTHADQRGTEDRNTPAKLPWTTVRETIGNLPPLGPGEKHSTIPNHRVKKHGDNTLRLIRSIPKDGGSRKDLPRELWLECHKNLKDGGAESVYGRMRWDTPAPTITTRCTTPSCGRFLHPEQDREITAREAARLQTFRDDILFPNVFAYAEWLIGNAVPPVLMASIASGFVRGNRRFF